MEKNKSRSRRIILILQLIVCLYSLSGIAGKFASRYPFLSFGFIMCYGIEIFILGIYAIVWQQILKKTDISIAYLNKASCIFWSLLWSAIVFKESISIQNVVGVVIIFLGIVVVNRNA